MREGIIYALIIQNDSRCYIGQTIDASRRRFDHFRLLRQGKHKNYKLQEAYSHGVRFEYTVLESGIPEDQLDDREKYWIAYYDSYDNGFNLTSGGQWHKKIPRKGKMELVPLADVQKAQAELDRLEKEIAAIKEETRIINVMRKAYAFSAQETIRDLHHKLGFYQGMIEARKSERPFNFLDLFKVWEIFRND